MLYADFVIFVLQACSRTFNAVMGSLGQDSGLAVPSWCEMRQARSKTDSNQVNYWMVKGFRQSVAKQGRRSCTPPSTFSRLEVDTLPDSAKMALKDWDLVILTGDAIFNRAPASQQCSLARILEVFL